MPVSTVDKWKKLSFVSIEIIITWGVSAFETCWILIGWFNSNILHRSYIFLSENDIFKSPSNKMLSYEAILYIIISYASNFWISKILVGSFWERGLIVPSINHFEFKSLNSNGNISIKVLGRQIYRDL